MDMNSKQIPKPCISRNVFNSFEKKVEKICNSIMFQNCIMKPDICHDDAWCMDGVCKCRDGYEGNGYECNQPQVRQT